MNHALNAKVISIFGDNQIQIQCILPVITIHFFYNFLLLFIVMLRINEIFYTIQGEGPNMGRPSIFVRLAGCNLRCYWCDTQYTWLYSESLAEKVRSRIPDSVNNVELTVYNRDEESHKQAKDEILTKIYSYPGTHVVITGGEPLLQQAELQPLLAELIDKDYTIEIETNGTVNPSSLDLYPIRYNVSPKLENSYNPKELRYQPEILSRFKQLDAIFKFVVSTEQDLQEIKTIIDQINLPAKRIYLMPEGRTSSELAEKSQWIIELCKKNNYQYTHRLHIDLFSATRGV